MLAGAVLSLTSPEAMSAEKTFAPIAVSGMPAPGTTNGVVYSPFGFQRLDLAPDGTLALVGGLQGPGITSANNAGIWAGRPGGEQLMAQTGQTLPSGQPFKSLGELRISPISPTEVERDFLRGLLWFIANPTNTSADGFLVGVKIWRDKEFEETFFGINLEGQQQVSAAKKPVTASGSYVALPVEFSGPGINPLNSAALMLGRFTNFFVVAQNGSPAPGTGGNYFSPPEIAALLPDGRVVFAASVSDGVGEVLFMGSTNSVQPLAISGQPAPETLLGPGYTYNYLSLFEGFSANARGEVAFRADLSGPGLNPTNSMALIAGSPDSPRIVARSGTPAPGTAEYFQSFDKCVIGNDGRVVFLANISVTGFDYGLWLALSNQPPVLITRTGDHAPGTPAGVVFSDVSAMAGPYMNRAGQFIFFTEATGPGIGSTNNTGIWLVQPDGTLELLVRGGDEIDIGGGDIRQLTSVSFGATEDLSVSGGEDGRHSPFNDRSEVAFIASWNQGLGVGRGVFLIRVGLHLQADQSGDKLLLRFPTESGKHYRVDYADQLPPSPWLELIPSIAGDGATMTVTNSTTGIQRFFRVVRLD